MINRFTRRGLLQSGIMSAIGFQFTKPLSAQIISQTINNPRNNQKTIEAFVPSSAGNLDFFSHFTKTYGVQVKFNSYSRYGDFVKLLLADKLGGDFYIISSSVASLLVKSGRAQKMDWAKVPNYQFPNYETISNNYDPKREYSIPVGYSYTTLGYDKIAFPEAPTSWGAIFDQKPPKARIGWQDYGMDMFNIAGAYMGYGFNVYDKKILAKINVFLHDNIKNINRLMPGASQEYLANREVSHLLAYSSSMSQIMVENNHVQAVYPNEGVMEDEAVAIIRKDTPNLESVYTFINYFMIPLVGKSLSESTGVNTPYDSFLRKTSIKYQRNKIIRPNIDKDVKIHPYLALDLSHLTLIENYWNEIVKNAPKV